MVAFIASLLITAFMVAVVVAVARRRPPGTPLTWGEAFVAATWVFTLLFVVYGVVPHQWLAWADSELKWRSDIYGVPYWPGKRLWANGITFGGRGRILVSLEDIRDIIATLIYVVALGANIYGWSWWQKRGRTKAAAPEALTSAFGRPLIRKT